MSRVMLIGEVNLSSVAEAFSSATLLKLDVVHVRSDLVNGDTTQELLNDSTLGLENPVRHKQQSVKLSVSLRGATNKTPITELTAVCLQGIRKIVDRVDFIELEADLDLTSAILEIIPPQKRIITWREKVLGDRPLSADALIQRFEAIADIEAYLYRIVTQDGLVALEFLHKIAEIQPAGNSILKKNVTAYAAGVETVWSRIAATYKGASVIFAEIGGDSPISLDNLIHTYCLPNLPAVEELYGIAGDPIMHSLSTPIHNAALRTLGLPGIYLPFPTRKLESLQNVIQRLDRIDLPIKGLTVTSPLKEAVSKHYSANRTIVGKAQSANVLLLQPGAGRADTTDDFGLTSVLDQNEIAVRGKRTAVIGCGSSGRVIAYTLRRLGARVVLFNRSQVRGNAAQQLLGIPYRPLTEIDPSEFDLLVNTAAFDSELDIPFSFERLNSCLVLIDFVYRPYPGVLVTQARRQGLVVIDGLEVLSNQLHSQFCCLTGGTIPPDIILAELQNYRNQSIPASRTSANSIVDQSLSVNAGASSNFKAEEVLEVRANHL